MTKVSAPCFALPWSLYGHTQLPDHSPSALPLCCIHTPLPFPHSSFVHLPCLPPATPPRTASYLLIKLQYLSSQFPFTLCRIVFLQPTGHAPHVFANDFAFSLHCCKLILDWVLVVFFGFALGWSSRVVNATFSKCFHVLSRSCFHLHFC